jgi:hypothetical protein
VVRSTNRPRLVLAGGCGSSGTTLLANLLGRHSAIVAAPELDVFNHEEVLSLDALRAGCDELFDRRRLSRGFKLVASFFGPRESLGVERSTFERWVTEARSIDDFYASFAAHMCAARGASYFVEKTPTNVYTFRDFARAHQGIPLIHQIRDGRDVAASLFRRGKSLFYAGSRWLYDTSAGIAARGSPAYLETRYEALASDPATTLQRVLAHLGLDYEPTMLDASPAREASTYEEEWRSKTSAKEWRSTPSDPVSASSVGRYRATLSSSQLAMLCRIRLTERAAEDLGAVARTFGELLEHLEYDRDAGDAASAIHAAPGLRERGAAWLDHMKRAERSLRYTRRLPRIVTTLSA